MKRTYELNLGVIPTRRTLFSIEDAILQKEKLYARLQEMGIAYTDIEDINEEGLLFDERDLPAVIETMKQANVDALFFPHANFGTEDLVCKVARELKKPVLIWGPKDERPLPDGQRLRDSQCGVFATGKILRRFQVPFSYMNQCTVDDPYFSWRLENFLRAANVVKELRGLTILQIGTRPAGFWTVMVNEGELLEKFDVRIHPVDFVEVKEEMERIRKEEPEKIQAVIQNIRDTMHLAVTSQAVENTAALKCAVASLMEQFRCKAAAIQCWNALQSSMGLFPCVANALLNEDGYPVACETDIHGAITSVLVQAANLFETPSFFADWTVPHPDNPNAELLQHCGPWPASLMKETPTFGAPFAFHHSHPGALHGEIRGGEMSIVRFDGDNGEYSLLMGGAKGCEGPFNQGTYVWIEVDNLKKLEAKIVEGPYIHHCTGVHGDVLPVLYEALKFIPGLQADFYDRTNADMDALLRGEQYA